MDCSLPGSSVHGILQGRILQWVTILFSGGSSQQRDRTRSPALQADSVPTELSSANSSSPHPQLFQKTHIQVCFLITIFSRWALFSSTAKTRPGGFQDLESFHPHACFTKCTILDTSVYLLTSSSKHPVNRYFSPLLHHLNSAARRVLYSHNCDWQSWDSTPSLPNSKDHTPQPLRNTASFPRTSWCSRPSSLVSGDYACVQSLSCAQLLATSWTAARQAPLSMGFPKQEYWSGLPFPPPGDLPDPGIKPVSPALAGGFFTTVPPEKPRGTAYSSGKNFCNRLWPGAGLTPPTTLSTSLIPQAAFLFLFKAANIWGQVATLLHVLFFFLFGLRLQLSSLQESTTQSSQASLEAVVG